MKIETNTALENYELLKSLSERKKSLEKHKDQTAIKAIDNMINQFKGYPCYRVIIEEN